MCSRRTQQQLLPHTFLLADLLHTQQPTDTVHVCKWKWMSNTPQGGQRSARLHSGTSLCRLHSRCVVLLSHCSPWECFCWGNTILSFHLLAASEGGCVTFSVSLCPSIPAGSLPTLHLSCGRRNPQPKHEMRFRESLQILSFVEWLSPQTSLNKHRISSQI